MMTRALTAIALLAGSCGPAPEDVASRDNPETGPIQEIQRAWVGDQYTYDFQAYIELDANFDWAIRGYHPPTAAMTCPVLGVSMYQPILGIPEYRDVQYAYPSTTLCTVNGGYPQTTICRCGYAQRLHSTTPGTHIVDVEPQCPYGAWDYYHSLWSDYVTVPSAPLPITLFGPFKRKGYWKAFLQACSNIGPSSWDMSYYENQQVCYALGYPGGTPNLICANWEG
jgi:hypothetical protein